MDYVQMSKTPELENALMIAAFAGWNDAASAATWALKFLVNQWEATPFAEIDPEVFYDFTETRPRVRIASGSLRRLSWPANRFYAFHPERVEDTPRGRDIVLLLGDEPQLRWKTFTSEILQVAKACNVREVAMLGALVAEVPHTAPAPVSGAASEQKTLRLMEREGIERVSYEGNTGILTVLQDGARKEGIATASLWGSAPHYVSATPNLPVSEALLDKLNALYGFDLRLNDLARASKRFTARVSTLVAADPDVSAYVRELEQRGEQRPNGRNTFAEFGASGTPLAGDASGVHRIPVDGELPTPEEAIQDVEEWLRQYRGDVGGDA